MAELASRTRTTLRLPRVEFDLSGLLLGMAGYLAYQASWDALAGLLGIAGRVTEKIPGLTGGTALRMEVFHALNAKLQLPGLPWLFQQLGWRPVPVQSDKGVQLLTELPSLQLAWWEYAVVGVAFLLLWSVIGGALSRVHAKRIARDESEGVFDALVFSLGSLRGFLMAPLFVAAAAAFFIALNVLAGMAVSIPWAGPVLQLVLHPLALIGGAVITVIALGGVFGLPIMHAALVTERNGTLDAISRTFSYLFTRPVQFLAGCAVVFVISALLWQCGMWFLTITGETLLAGARIVSGGEAGGAAAAQSAQAVLAQGMQTGLALSWPTDVELATPQWLSFHVSWLFGYAARLLVQGAVLSYIVGGLTDVYFLLRGEVDGIEDSEIYVEDEGLSLGDPVPEDAPRS